MPKSTCYLRCWTFTPPEGGKPISIQAVFDMTEEQARERLAAKGRDVLGWKAEQKDVPVLIEEAREGGPGTYKVTVKARAYATRVIEVEAESEEEAEQKALDEAEDSGSFDWDFEIDDVEAEDVEEVG